MQYFHYIGDGDTEYFKKTVDSKPYADDIKPIKLECDGHAQKPLGTGRQKLKSDMKSKVVSDGKRKWKTFWNKIQKYFGMAICRNTAAIKNDWAKAFYSMKKWFLQSYGIALICWILRIYENFVQAAG